MTTKEAIERIQNIIERGNHINRGVHFTDKDLKVLDKAIEVMTKVYTFDKEMKELEEYLKETRSTGNEF